MWSVIQMPTTIDPNMLDFANLSALIGNIALIFPGVVALVVGVIPILFILAIVGLVFSIFGSIISMIEGLMRSVFK
jgi:ABC-type multidrug transport system permease subunit